MLYRLFIYLSLLGISTLWVPAQTQRVPPPDNMVSAEKSRSDEDDKNFRLGTPEAEMLRKRRLEFEKKQYRDHLARAREAAQIGATLKTNFERQQDLSKDDLKKLERLEKLARGIRKNMSEESDPTPLETAPTALAQALAQLDTTAQELEKEVVATPRRVVSAAVIEKACLVEALAHYLREHWGGGAQ